MTWMPVPEDSLCCSDMKEGRHPLYSIKTISTCINTMKKPIKPIRKIKKKIKRQPTVNLKKANFIRHLIKNNFHLRKTCTQTDTRRLNYYQWVRDDPEFAKKIEELREIEVDLFEDAFRELIKEGNPQAIMFGLKTRGKNRGYVEKQEIEHTGIDNINISFGEPVNPGNKEKVIKEEPPKEIE